MAKKISPIELTELLESGNSTKRQKAIKHIDKQKLVKYAPALFQLLQDSKGSAKADYDERYYLCIALGSLQHSPAITYLESFAKSGGVDSLGAAMSYLRLTRKKGDDFSAFFDYIKEGKALEQKGQYTTLERAALAVICNDKLLPETQDEQEHFVDYAWEKLDHPTYEEDGSIDYGHLDLIAPICAGFEKVLVKELLYKILEIGMMEKSYIQHYATDALKGKYNTYNPMS
jgi:hypothetical protein